MAMEEYGPHSSLPGKFDYLKCPEIAARARAAVLREADLMKDVDKANGDAVGPAVSFLIYRDELSSVRAEQYALRKASDDKRCTPNLEPLH
jgi:hypothetical protein